jgi:hypothetical protein
MKCGLARGLHCCAVMMMAAAAIGLAPSSSLAARIAVPRRALLDPLEAAWRSGVDRTQREVEALRQAAATVSRRHWIAEEGEPRKSSPFADAVTLRARRAEAALGKNGEFMSFILDSEPPEVSSLWDDEDDDASGEPKMEKDRIVQETKWGVCVDDASMYYTSIEEVLGHLCRDYGEESFARQQMFPLVADAVEAAATRLADQCQEEQQGTDECIVLPRAREGGGGGVDSFFSEARPVRVLVPGAGAAGLVWHLAAHIPSAHVVGTECSKELAAAASHMVSAPRNNDDEGPNAAATIYPWALTFGNIVVGDSEDQFAPCKLMYVPASQRALKNMELVLSDVFADHVSDMREGAIPRADIVVTVFTVDAVSMRHFSTLRTLDRIAELLSDSRKGCWINLGPLVYHSASAAPKLSAQELVTYMADVHGFVDAMHPLVELPPMPYARPQHTSMAASHHASVFFGLCKRG